MVLLTIVTSPAWVEIILDTKPPKVKIAAVESVTPPAAWVVRLTADEDIEGGEFIAQDSLGRAVAVGYEALDDRTLVVSVPTEGLTAGPLVLEGLVWDEVENTVPVVVQSFVQGVAAFEVEMTLGPSYDVNLRIDRAYTVEATLGRGFQVSREIGRA